MKIDPINKQNMCPTTAVDALAVALAEQCRRRSVELDQFCVPKFFAMHIYDIEVEHAATICQSRNPVTVGPNGYNCDSTCDGRSTAYHIHHIVTVT